MSSDDGREYVQALSRLIETCASTYPGSAARDAAARDVENRSRRRPLALELDGDLLRIGGDDAVPFEAPGTEALVSAFLAHAIGRMSIRQLTPARDFLEMARLLSVRPSDPQGGHAIEREVSDARLWNVEFIGLASLDSKPVTALLPAEMLLSLRDGADYAHAEAALAKLATRGEEALAEGDARTVAAVLVAMSTFEQESHHDNLRHTAELAMKRLISPMALRLTAQLIPSARRRESLIAVLSQAGEDGAEALFAHLVASQDMHERRAYFDAMVALGSGISMLMQALDDEQWYVARNAAELLGEMRVDGVEGSLALMLKSPEEPRRIAAASALARLRTPDALAALHEAVNDPSAQVRYFASSATIARIEGSSARQLGVALDADGDPDMKLQIISALGRLGTPDAVQKLIKTLLSPQGGRGSADMSSEFRCASIEAVADARGGAALSVIAQFRRDRDPRVAETATRIYARLASESRTTNRATA
jgi:HEAT repeat protein